MKFRTLNLFVLILFLSKSFFTFAQTEETTNHSILRFESKNQAGVTVYAVAIGDIVKALTINDAEYKNNMANSLWLVQKSGSGFTIQNVGTGLYLSQDFYTGTVGAKKGNIHFLDLSTTAMQFFEDETGYYYVEKDYSNNKAYIQYDPVRNQWFFYTVGATFPHNPKNESQATAGQTWSDDDFPQSDASTSVKIEGADVDEMFDGNITIDDIKDVVTDFVEKQDVSNAPITPIEIGKPATYPDGNYWKTATIKLQVNSADWTPVSFPVDVKCVTDDLSGVGYQYYDTEARANGEKGWVTKYITSSTKFEKGVAYHFATESKEMILDFEPVNKANLTAIENNFSKTLSSTGGKPTDANWYYIGNALFKNAGMSAVTHISRYDKSVRKWVPEEVSGVYDPFDAFFVQYSGDYAMSTSTTKTNAPMRDRKVVTEKYCLNIVGEDTEDKTYLYFEDGASAEGYVIGEDFLSFATIGGANTEIYTYAGDINYSFNTRPIENTLVYVGLYIAKAGTYTISLDNISGNAETFVLYDNYEQDFVRLHLGETYTFYSERGEFNDRFGVAVIYAPEVPTDNISLSANKLIVLNNEIQGLTLDSELVVYDSTGRLVCAINVDSETMILPNLNSGIYIARNGNGWVKILVK